MERYRTILISDTHLGGPCNDTALLSFLRDNDADTWYIVGDFLDSWAIKRSRSWPMSHSVILQKILRKARKGQKFIILPGNHDSELRSFEGYELGNISVVDKAIYTTSAGKKYVVIHGDLFDSVIGHAEWLARIGAAAYDALILFNTSLNWIRKIFGLPFWSMSAAIKKMVKSAVSYVSHFEGALTELARQHQADGVVCGHIHCPVMKMTDGIHYVNTGDWVESLTAVVEHEDGTLELKYYTEH